MRRIRKFIALFTIIAVTLSSPLSVLAQIGDNLDELQDTIVEVAGEDEDGSMEIQDLDSIENEDIDNAAPEDEDIEQNNSEDAEALPFTVRNESFPFDERTVAVVIDAGQEVDGSTLDIENFQVDVHKEITLADPTIVVDGQRTITAVYTSQVDMYGKPAETGRYIVLEFLSDYTGLSYERAEEHDMDCGSTSHDGLDTRYLFDVYEYSISYSGSIGLTDGGAIEDAEFAQKGVISPLIDQFQYGEKGNTQYRYFISEESDEPLPLVIFFHGGGKGGANEMQLRFSMGSTIWTTPENQAKYPTHVLAPSNTSTPEGMRNLMEAIQEWIDDGVVDPDRIYVTGFSMGGGSTWTFLNTFPDVPAAAAPLCAAGGPANVEAAKAVADLPIWAFVTEGDQLCQGMVNNVTNTYGPYFNNYKITTLENNVTYAPPYNGFVFHPHACWVPVYTETTDPERGMLIDWMFAQSKKNVTGEALPFTVRNESFPFDERTVAVVIDAGQEVDGSTLNIEDFQVDVHKEITLANPTVIVDGQRTITNVYTSQVDMYGEPAETGRYIVLEFLSDYTGLSYQNAEEHDMDCGSTSHDGLDTRYMFDVYEYSISYNGSIGLADGSAIETPKFLQTEIISPLIDQFQYGEKGNTQYRYFISEESDEPLPLVIFFHGSGKGGANEMQIRFSMGATIWTTPENQAKNPCHVMAPSNTTSAAGMRNLMEAIQEWIDDGIVDPDRIYVTGFSMGGGSTWTFLNTFPGVVAAAAPLCGGSPGSIENAMANSMVPIWAFVTVGDGEQNHINNEVRYGPYFEDYKLTVLENNATHNYPYNGFIFHPHACWVPIYSETTDAERGTLMDWFFTKTRQEASTDMPFTVRNESFPFDERTVAVVIDAGQEVDGSTLSIEDFQVDVHKEMTALSTPIVVDGQRTITKAYTSQVDHYGEPSDNGRYIVLEFLSDYTGRNYENGEEHDMDCGSTSHDGLNGSYIFDVYKYSIAYNGAISLVGGDSIARPKFTQTAVISPIIDQFQYGQEDTMPYRYFINEEADEPLPLVIFFHGGGKGVDNELQVRFSNGATVWAQPENQAKNPTHVLAPANANGRMQNVVAIVERWIEEGLVDPDRIYATGFSFGGSATWELVNNYPDLLAAAVPLCGSGSPTSVEHAKAASKVPIWMFLTVGDNHESKLVTAERYRSYFDDYKITLLENNAMQGDPYHGFIFHPHACWVPVYNETTDSERGKLIDWLFDQVKPPVAVESINLNAGSLNMLSIGKTLELNPTILPENAADKTVTYTSNNPNVASVDENGVVTAHKTGTALITATASSGKVSKTTVRVTY